MHNNRGISIEELEQFVSDAENGYFVTMKDTLNAYPNQKERIINFQLPYHQWKSSGAILMHGETALFMASSRGHLNIVKFLVENDANVNLFVEFVALETIKTREYPMDVAAISNNLAVLKYLKLQNAVYSGMALNVAAGRGYLEVIKYLIEIGCDVNSLHDNYTPLGMAAACNQLEVVKVLLSYGANVDQLDGRGSSPLQYAVTKNHKGMVELLILAGANIGLTLEENGQRAIDYAYNPEIKNMLRIYSFLPKLKNASSVKFITEYKRQDALSNITGDGMDLIRKLQSASACPTLVEISTFSFIKHNTLTPDLLTKVIPTTLVNFFKEEAISREHIKYVEMLEEKEAKENSTSEANVI